MATITYMTYLMHKESGTFKKLIDITEYPDLDGDTEQLETTTLSNKNKTYTPGLQDTGALEFGANYDLDDYKKCKALEGAEHDFAVWFGGAADSNGDIQPDGSDGKWEFSGKLRVAASGGGSNAVRGMKITFSTSTDIKFVE